MECLCPFSNSLMLTTALLFLEFLFNYPIIDYKHLSIAFIAYNLCLGIVNS